MSLTTREVTMPSREFTTAPSRRDEGAVLPSGGRTTFDPLRYCIFTTIALLAWLVGPAVMVMAMSAFGIAAYSNAMRLGLTRSRCVLGDTRLVMLYLLAAFVAALASLVHGI